MTKKETLQSLAALGNYIKNMQTDEHASLLEQTGISNPWFTKNNVNVALEGLGNFLDPDKLEKWSASYEYESTRPKNVGIVMAGNIPLVGFHDFVCVLASGHTVNGKLSSQDAVLLPFLVKKLVEINPKFEDRIVFKEQLKGIDAVIATGSDNTARYFNYYFSKIPNIIRKNRSSCTILTGNEGEAEYALLGNDMFQYFGLGCRNVSKLYVPKDFDFVRLIDAVGDQQNALEHYKYKNNYDYNKSIYLVNKVDHLDSGYFLVTENEALVSPISVLYYEYFEDQTDLTKKIEQNRDQIQCIVSKDANFLGSVAFGEAQKPELEDYADDVDTMAFLSKLS